MCGIAGLIAAPQSSGFNLEALAARMGSTISRRGPDSSGVWVDQASRVALSHQRLSILDLTSSGSQPMVSESGRYVISYNGEIYNHKQIRIELEQTSAFSPWFGSSDTETLLVAIEAWGLEAALNRCLGMWAFALFDRKERVLHLARDRFGEKPLYWGFSGTGSQRSFLFASELAALRAYPAFNNNIDRQSLAEFLRFGYVPTPLSIYEGISKLPPGHLLTVPLPLDHSKYRPVSRPWWQLHDVIQAGHTSPISSDVDSLNALETTLSQVVADHAISDVALGAFLSGGIDSSLVAAILQRQSSKSLRTFTIGFEEDGFNEAPYARAVAAHLGTDHVETLVTSDDAQQLIPQLPQIYSEPFADSSQLPTHLVCREARRCGLTVALSGDGADELFGGYNRYFWGPRIWNRLSWMPSALRQRLGSAIHRIPPQAWDFVGGPLSLSQLGHKAHKLAYRLNHVDSSDDLYRSLVCEWRDPAALLQRDLSTEHSTLTAIDLPLPACLQFEPVHRMMAWDSLSYLPDDILVKVDRAAMAVGLETRAPFLDHRVASLAWRLPLHMKIRSGTSKWALRQILYKYVPRDLIDRPKAGFAIPIGHWLRGPLCSWADQLLHPDRLKHEGYLRPEPISHLWQQHLSGRYDHTTKLWTVLMWQAWLEQCGS